MKFAAAFSKKTDEWSTPTGVYSALDREFGFSLDPCALGGSEDGTAPLFCSWEGHSVFCNPPYSSIRPFLERWREARRAIYLIPARTDTRWFHEIVLPHAAEIRFIKGRLKFGDAKNSAPFPSMIVIFES